MVLHDEKFMNCLFIVQVQKNFIQSKLSPLSTTRSTRNISLVNAKLNIHRNTKKISVVNLSEDISQKKRLSIYSKKVTNIIYVSVRTVRTLLSHVFCNKDSELHLTHENFGLAILNEYDKPNFVFHSLTLSLLYNILIFC